MEIRTWLSLNIISPALACLQKCLRIDKLTIIPTQMATKIKTEWLLLEILQVHIQEAKVMAVSSQFKQESSLLMLREKRKANKA